MMFLTKSSFSLFRNSFLLVFIVLSVGPLKASDTLATSDKRFVAVIDAGHGGHDAGAMGDFAWEKDINLNIALELGRLVKKKSPDIDIVFTRSSDRYLTLEDRALIANENNADVFISIHTNSTPSSKVARGTETYFIGPATCPSSSEVEQIENSSAQKYESDYLERYKINSINSAALARNMDKSELLARMVQEEYIVKANRVNRGVREARFYVLLHTQMPSILTEVGFITTLDEESYLTSDKGVRESAQCIYDALLKYKTLASDEESCNLALSKMRSAKNSSPSENVPMLLDETVGLFDSSVKVDERSVVATLRNKVADTTEHHKNDKKLLTEARPAEVVADKSVAKKKSTVSSAEKSVLAAAAKPADEKSAVSGNATKLPVQAAPAVKDNKSDIRFYVQVFAVSNPIKDGDERIKGLENIEFRKSGKMYKCICSPSSDYSGVKKNLEKVRKKYPDAYIIAYESDKEIKVSEALDKIRNKKEDNRS